MKIKNKKILLYSLLTLAILSFEILFCNNAFVYNLLHRNNPQYIFSFARIGLYIIFYVLCYLSSKKIIKNREIYESEEHKYKKLIDVCLIICFVGAILVNILYIVLNRTSIMSEGLIIILLCYISFIYFFHGKNYKINLILLLSISFVYSLVVTPNHAIDEKIHFDSAYNLAHTFDKKCNIISSNSIDRIPLNSGFNRNNLNFIHYDKNDVLCNDDVMISDASKYLYIPSMLGIMFSESLNGTIMDTFYIGRMFNAIGFILLSILLLKIIPFKLNAFTAVLMTPYLILLSSTYSVDGYGFLLISIFVAYILKLYRSSNKYLTKKEILFVILSALSILLFKGGSYFFIYLLLLLLIKKVPKKYKWLVVVGTLLLMALACLKIVLPTNLDSGDERGGDTNMGEQLKFLFSSPLVFIKVYGYHFLNCFFNFGYYYGFYGEYFYPFVSKYLLIPYILLMLYFAFESDDQKLKIFEKIIFIIVSLLIFFFTSTALYLSFTEVGSLHIEGYQSRYIYPMLPMLFMCIANKFVLIKKSKDHEDFNFFLILGLEMVFIFIIVFAQTYEYWI